MGFIACYDASHPAYNTSHKLCHLRHDADVTACYGYRALYIASLHFLINLADMEAEECHQVIDSVFTGKAADINLAKHNDVIMLRDMGREDEGRKFFQCIESRGFPGWCRYRFGSTSR